MPERWDKRQIDLTTLRGQFQIKHFVEFGFSRDVAGDTDAPSLVRVLHKVHLKEC
jgi:hypothetical protein